MRFFKFLLFALLLYGTARFCHRATEGFQVIKVQGNLISDNQDDLLPAEVDKILDQKFTYLARGLQSFAFVSEDQKYVLKLLNNRTQRKTFWLNLLPDHSPWENWKKKRIEVLEAKLSKTFASYEIAESEMKDETAILYLHLYKGSNQDKKLKIVDKLGILHELSLSNTGFILQKRAELCYPYLKSLKEAGQTDLAKESLGKIVDLLVNRCKMGIHDSDPLIRTNLGFIEGRPILIDVGPFSHSEKIKDPSVYKQEILRITASLKDWVQKNYPELQGHLEQELEVKL